jgi:membrane-associated protease RseP (regulator of RpoE activity)
MTGPKHLWSGDWQSESDAASDQLAGRRLKTPEPEPTAPPAAATRARPRFSLPRRPRLGRPFLLGSAAAVLVVVVGYGLVALFGSSGNSTTAGPFAATTSSRPVSWLGMEIATVPPGAAVIETVRLGSPGDRAGLEPGEVILEINNRPIGGAGDIAGAIRGLHPGDRVVLQISHGSALYQTQATLAAPPSAYP